MSRPPVPHPPPSVRPRRWGLGKHALMFFFVFGPAWFWVVGPDVFTPTLVYAGLVVVVRLVRRGARR